MKNIPSIMDVQYLSDEELVSLDLVQLAVLHGEAEQSTSAIAAAKKRVINAVMERHADEVSNLTVGSVKVARGPVEATITRAKKVTWDQDGLNIAADTFTELGFDPLDIIDVKLSVSEKKFNEQTGQARAILEVSRTVSPGTLSIKFRSLENGGSE